MKREFIDFLEAILEDIKEQCNGCAYKLTCLEEECTLFNIETDILDFLEYLEDEK